MKSSMFMQSVAEKTLESMNESCKTDLLKYYIDEGDYTTSQYSSRGRTKVHYNLPNNWLERTKFNDTNSAVKTAPFDTIS